MIRDFKAEDLDRLIGIIDEGYIAVEDDVKNSIENNGTRIIVYDDNGIKGLAAARMPDGEAKTCIMILYVQPCERRKHIGSMLYNEIYKYVEDIKPNVIVPRFRVDVDDPSPFFRKLGYKKWFGSHDMQYLRGFQPSCGLDFVTYEDEYFEEYVNALRDCFYDMRKENDIKPYRCFEANDNVRSAILLNKENIYLHFQDGKLVSSVVINDEYLDDIFVRPEYQGKGYGRKTVQFGINKAILQGAGNIFLGVMEWNRRAIDLYRSLGFEIIQTVHSYRQFADR